MSVTLKIHELEAKVKELEDRLTHPELPRGEWIDWPAEKGIPVGMQWRWDKNDDDPATSIDESWLPDKPCQIFITPDPRVAELEAEVRGLQCKHADQVLMAYHAQSENRELLKVFEQLKADLARAEEAAKCWRLMTDAQRDNGAESWRMVGPDLMHSGATAGGNYRSTPEAAVLAVCEPKPEPVLTLGTAELGRWVQPDIGGANPHYKSTVGCLCYCAEDDGGWFPTIFPPSTPCHYIEDPREKEAEASR